MYQHSAGNKNILIRPESAVLVADAAHVDLIVTDSARKHCSRSVVIRGEPSPRSVAHADCPSLRMRVVRPQPTNAVRPP
jgi:hypothetical protein